MVDDYSDDPVLNQRELLDLFDRVAFGSGIADDLRQLERLTKADNDFALAYLNYVSIETELSPTLHQQWIDVKFAQQLRASVVDSGDRVQRLSRFKKKAAVVALVAATMLCFVSLWPSRTDEIAKQAPTQLEDLPPPDGAAMVTGVMSLDAKSSATIRTGTHLLCGDELRFVSGQVTLEFHGGVSVVLSGPTELTLDSPASATLHRGRIAAYVPSWAVGFYIDTLTTRVIDHGTSFAVSVDEFQAVEVAVAEGEVELASRDSSGSVIGSCRLMRGDAMRLDGGFTEQPRDLESLRELDDHLPERADKSMVTVVASYQKDFQNGTTDKALRDGNWRFLTNASSRIGVPSGYKDLLWTDENENNSRKQYDINGTSKQPAKGGDRFVSLQSTGGHPGRGRNQGSDNLDHYAIAAFTVPKAGNYRIASGWLCRRKEDMQDPEQSLDVVVHVNDGPVLLQEFCDQSGLLKFSGDLGQLTEGSTIYVGAGPSGYDFRDGFRWNFKIVRVLE